MKVVVTGGGGFLGRRIVEMFLASEAAFERLTAKLLDPVDAEGSAAARVDSPSQSGSAALDAEPTAITPRDRPAIALSSPRDGFPY